MSSPRNFAEYEPKWQASWEDEGVYQATEGSGEKFYGLIEFPYPSGEGLHTGHPRSYTAIDIVCRKRRMEEKNVLYPIGWDAFGLPTENFAIKHKVKPQDATEKNIGTFRRQLKSLGLGFDWTREVNTTDPAYYKWTQWMFLQFFKSRFDESKGRAVYVEDSESGYGLRATGTSAESDARRPTPDVTDRMAYKTKTTINWCPSCKIGLANEEAVGGVCERCGSPVEKREKEQWMIRITKYAERLLQDLETVDFSERIKKQQVDWIGRSEGAEIKFQITNSKPVLSEAEGSQTSSDEITVFTTRPDTLFGVTYMVFAPEHDMVSKWIEDGTATNADDVRSYRAEAAKKTDIERSADEKEKSGVKLEGVMAINPVNNEEIPVFIADYVMMGYGTGAIMAVPAHDERDYAFAQKFDLPIVQVVEPPADKLLGIGVLFETDDGHLILQERDEHAPTRPEMIAPFGGGKEEQDADGIDCAIREMKEELGLSLEEGDLSYVATVESHNFPGKYLCVYAVKSVSPDTLDVREGKGAVVLDAAAALAHERVTEFTKDVIRSWKGTQTQTWHPSIWSDEGVSIRSGFITGLSTTEAKQKITSWLEEKGLGKKAINFKLRDWVFSRQRYWGEPIPIINCPKCGYVPVPEEQLPVVLPDVESYEPTDSGESPLAKIRDWVEATCPSCGGAAERETDTMPNWAGSSWYFLRYTDPHNNERFASEEALKRWMPVDLYNGGMEHTTLHLLYSRFWHKMLFDLGHIPEECGPEPYMRRRSHGLVLAEGGEKMSKSKGNVVNPDDVVEQYGADVFRVYEMFMGPFEQPVPWDTNGIEGVKRFLDKVWRLFESPAAESQQPAADLETIYHQSVKKVSEDIESLGFNTAVSQLMILTNAFQDAGGVPESMREGFLKILAPFAPHMTEELWKQTGHEGSIHRSDWPSFDAAKAIAATFELVIQINGKVRDRIEVPSDISEENAKAQALASEKVQTYLEGKKPKKIIYVKGKLVTIAI